MIHKILWNLLLVGQDRNRHSFRRIIEESSLLGMSPLLTHYSNLDVSIKEKTEILIDGRSLPDTIRAVILDGPGPYTVLRNLLVPYFTSLGIYVLNGRSFLKWPTLSKLTQTYQLNRAGIPIVPTRLFGNSSRLVALADEIETSLILKAVDGSGGKNTWQLSSGSDLYSGPLRNHAAYHLLVQPKIQAQTEFRVIVLGGRVLGGVQKTPAPGEFRANKEQGASFSNTSLPSIVEAYSLDSCKVLKCDFAGVDVLYSRENSTEVCWILEVNRYLGFEGFEEATHINVASNVISWIENQL